MRHVISKPQARITPQVSPYGFMRLPSLMATSNAALPARPSSRPVARTGSFNDI
ncbi:hypothetical protein R2083_09770 [Nitrosomonas sp. Is35]|uniref:hypothetical protein n=1 Tax=Nitrosomonas sp. Is35 TaxID=3080534 RepID=UPI00294B6838|nr:hypothetical protein [Nitrosomonas sp. Is35]MDV6347800.1 hypothetical protein [Nitrosomonas sp. Is35]